MAGMQVAASLSVSMGGFDESKIENAETINVYMRVPVDGHTKMCTSTLVMFKQAEPQVMFRTASHLSTKVPMRRCILYVRLSRREEVMLMPSLLCVTAAICTRWKCGCMTLVTQLMAQHALSLRWF